MTRNLALEWGPHRIRVCGIAPGPIADTPGLTKLSGGVGAEKMSAWIGETVPLGRAGTTADIGGAAVFLASPAASYITGTTLVVDGGEWLYSSPTIPRKAVSKASRDVEKKSRGMKASL